MQVRIPPPISVGDFIVIVPARLHSSRLPGKPLADIGGRAMIVRVLEQAKKSGAAQILAATDDEKIAKTAAAAGFQYHLTGECESGLARVAATARYLRLGEKTIVVNVQGDEPFIEPSLIRRTAELLSEKKECVLATAARPLKTRAEFNHPSTVKVLADKNNIAQAFSRAPIPFLRDDEKTVPPSALAHLGIYACRAGFLQTLQSLAPSPYEKIESLEQLRLLWHGCKIAVLKTESDSFGVDTKSDLARARRRIKNDLKNKE